jgi:hypothetical protein
MSQTPRRASQSAQERRILLHDAAWQGDQPNCKIAEKRREALKSVASGGGQAQFAASTPQMSQTPRRASSLTVVNGAKN